MVSEDIPIGGYGDVPTEVISTLWEVLDEILTHRPLHKYRNGKTALFWHIVATIDDAIERKDVK